MIRGRQHETPRNAMSAVRQTRAGKRAQSIQMNSGTDPKRLGRERKQRRRFSAVSTAKRSPGAVSPAKFAAVGKGPANFGAARGIFPVAGNNAMLPGRSVSAAVVRRLRTRFPRMNVFLRLHPKLLQEGKRQQCRDGKREGQNTQINRQQRPARSRCGRIVANCGDLARNERHGSPGRKCCLPI